MYYLLLAALMCYFLGEYALFQMRPSPLVGKRSILDLFLRLVATSAFHAAVLWWLFGFWGLAFAGALVLFHTTVDLITRPFFNMLTGKRVLLTLIDLALHIVCMYASSVLISLFFEEAIAYNTALIIRYGASAAMGALFFPALAKTLLVDGFPRYYSERALFELPEWLLDAFYGLACAVSALYFIWWVALIVVAVFTALYCIVGSQMQKGRPVLVLSKVGVLLLLLPCFFIVFSANI